LTNFIYFEQSGFIEKLTETRNKLFIAYYLIPVMNLGITKQAVDSFKIQNFPLLDSSRTLMIEYANYCELKQNNDRYVLGLEKDLFANETTLLRMLEEQYNIK